MEYVTLPNSDLKVSRVCLGCWQFNNATQSADKTWEALSIETSKEIVDKAIEVGINFFDTAEGYLNSEEVLGKVLEGRRRDVVVASKVGGRLKEYTPADIEQSLMGTLSRLKTDYIDLYQVHWPSFIKTNFAENLAEIKRLQAKGLIRHYSVCNFGPQNLQDALDLDFKPVTNQDESLDKSSLAVISELMKVPLNNGLLWRAIEYDILPVLERNNIGVLAYSPLQQGLLTGRYLKLDDVPEGRRRTRLFNCNSTSLSVHGTEGAEKQMFKAIHDLKVICEEVGLPMNQAALSWCFNQPAVQCVIGGASSPEHVEENVKLASLEKSVIERMNAVTDELKEVIGHNVDLWAAVSRMA